MALVMALQQQWAPKDVDFKVNNDIRGLIDSVNDGTTSAFMWEWFTTKPFQDAGEVRFIGSVPTPWASWMIAAHPVRASTDALKGFLSGLSEYVRDFDAPAKREKDDIEFIHEAFGYPKDDIAEWLKTVSFTDDCAKVDARVVLTTMNTLREAGVIFDSRDLNVLVSEDAANVYGDEN